MYSISLLLTLLSRLHTHKLDCLVWIRWSILITCPFPVCVFRSSTYLFISVCYTGSAEEPQHGENTEINSQWAPTHIKCNFSTGSVLLFIVTNDDILIRCLLFPSSPQTHGASSNINHRAQDRPHSSSARGSRAGRRRHHHHRQTPPSDQPQSTVQQILHPGNLLRRLLPSSSLFNSGSHASWAHTLYSWNK